MGSGILSTLNKFFRDKRGAVTTIISLSIIPLIVGTGVAIDLGRALKTKTQLQAALDAAVVSGVLVDPASRNAYAAALFTSQSGNAGAAVATPTFITNANKSFTGSASAVVSMTLMKLVGRNTLDLTLTATAAPPVEDNSCILALGHGLSVASDALKLNGGSNLNLTGCTLRSNVSMSCNGHTGNADASYAVGSAPGCNNPYPNSLPVQDVHAKLATNITRMCGLTSYNLNWQPGSPPSSPQMITVVDGSVTRYHVCGNLTLKGTGTILGNASSDSVLVVENGDLTIDKNADVTLQRTTIILTGSAGLGNRIKFPQGNGQSATLKLSPGIDVSNVWQGVGIYQDPALTSNIDISWGPGANLQADGVLYFPNADFTISGNAQSYNSNCTKLVVNEFTSNGAVNLKQSLTACGSIGLKQYKITPYLMT